MYNNLAHLSHLSHLGVLEDALADPAASERDAPIQVSTVLGQPGSDDEYSKQSREMIFEHVREDHGLEAFKMHVESSLDHQTSTNKTVPSTNGTSGSQDEEDISHQDTTAVGVTTALWNTTTATLLDTNTQSNTVTQQFALLAQDLHVAQQRINAQNDDFLQHPVSGLQNNSIPFQVANTNFDGQYVGFQNNSVPFQATNSNYAGFQNHSIPFHATNYNCAGLQGNNWVQNIATDQNNDWVNVAAVENHRVELAARRAHRRQVLDNARARVTLRQNDDLVNFTAPQNPLPVRQVHHRQNNDESLMTTPQTSAEKAQNKCKNIPGQVTAKVQKLCLNQGNDPILLNLFILEQEKEIFRKWFKTYNKEFKSWEAILRWLRSEWIDESLNDENLDNESLRNEPGFGEIFLNMMDHFLSPEFERRYNASIDQSKMGKDKKTLLKEPDTKALMLYKFGLVRKALGGVITDAEFQHRINTTTLKNLGNVLGDLPNEEFQQRRRPTILNNFSDMIEE